MNSQRMGFKVFVRSIAHALALELTEDELEMISKTVNGLFGLAIDEVSLSLVNQVQRRLPQDEHSRGVMRERTINTCLRRNDAFREVLRDLISRVTASSGDKRADCIGFILYWVTQGIETNRQFSVSATHL